MDEETIKWVCFYCREKQETPSLSALDVAGEKKYEEVIKEAAKKGGIACWNCFHHLTGYRKK